MKEYDEFTLKKIQRFEMDILKDFLEICKEKNLKYFAFGGTGIGALRHQGFIPWDDDIDVALPRKDYEILLKEFEARYPQKYTIGNGNHLENYPLMTTRIMLKGTKFVEEALKDIDCELGIFLDVYAFDNTPDDDRLMKKQAWKTWFWNKLLILRLIPYPVLAMSGIKKKIIHFICALVHYGLVILHIKPNWLYRQCKKQSTKYNHLTTKRMAYFCDTNPFVNMLEVDEIFPTIELPFEDITLAFPKELDKLLTITYGDYMQLPPVEKRKNHYPYCLEFGDEK